MWLLSKFSHTRLERTFLPVCRLRADHLFLVVVLRRQFFVISSSVTRAPSQMSLLHVFFSPCLASLCCLSLRLAVFLILCLPRFHHLLLFTSVLPSVFLLSRCSCPRWLDLQLRLVCLWSLSRHLDPRLLLSSLRLLSVPHSLITACFLQCVRNACLSSSMATALPFVPPAAHMPPPLPSLPSPVHSLRNTHHTQSQVCMISSIQAQHP